MYFHLFYERNVNNSPTFRRYAQEKVHSTLTLLYNESVLVKKAFSKLNVSKDGFKELRCFLRQMTLLHASPSVFRNTANVVHAILSFFFTQLQVSSKNPKQTSFVIHEVHWSFERQKEFRDGILNGVLECNQNTCLNS